MSMQAHPSASSHRAAPEGRSPWKSDIVSGFLVFLIALPLCLGIAMASGFPPVAGILTAMIGGLVSSWLGSARLTIKGPAAGLIVIALGAVTELGGGDNALGYRRAAGHHRGGGGDSNPLRGAAHREAGRLLPLLGRARHARGHRRHHLLQAGAHAAGRGAQGEGAASLLAEIPHSVATDEPGDRPHRRGQPGAALRPAALSKRVALLKRVPGPLLVLLFAVPLGLYFDLDHEHTFTSRGTCSPWGPGSS